MEFAPDISGVCSVAGTLLMTANPTRIARKKTVITNGGTVVSDAVKKLLEPAPAAAPGGPA
jgi:hypothetical protein